MPLRIPRDRHLVLACSIALASALPYPLRAVTSTTPNLLANPGAETGTIAGWTVGGSSTPRVDNGSFDAGLTPFTGSFDFLGGSGASGTLSQTVTLTGFAPTFEQIDAGLVSANVSAAERSLNVSPGSVPDGAGIALTSSGSTPLQYTSSESQSVSAWQSIASPALFLSAGGYSLTYTMYFNRHSGTDLDAFLDANSLTLTYPGASWKGAATANWSNASLWNGGVPTSGDALLTSATTPGNITFDGDYPNSPLANLYVDAPGAGMILSQAIDTMNALNEYIGNVANGTYSQSAGVNAADNLTLGVYPHSHGTYVLTGGILATSPVNFGLSGAADFIVSGNAIGFLGNVTLGVNAGSSGNLSMSNGNIFCSELIVGSAGAANLSLSGGNLTVTDNLSLSSAANCSLTLAGGTLALNSLNLHNTLSNFHWTGGTLEFVNDLNVDSSSPFGTSLQLSANQLLEVDGLLSVAEQSGGTLTLQGGSLLANTIEIDAFDGEVGSLNLQDPSSVITATYVFVGGTSASERIGANTLNISNGTTAISQLTIWPTGTVNLSGGTLAIGNLTLMPSATFNWTAGTLSFLSDTTIDSSFVLGNNIHLTNGQSLSFTNLANEGTINADAGSQLLAASLSNEFGGLINASFLSLTSNATSTNLGTLVASFFQSNGSFVNYGSFSVFNQGWSATSTFTNNFGNAQFFSDPGSEGTYVLAVTVNGGAVNFYSSQHLANLTITAGTAHLHIGALKSSALQISGGNLILDTGELILQSTPAAKPADLPRLRAYLASGAITDANLPAHFALALFDNAVTNFTTFAGLTVDQNSLIVSPELLGDANIDGHVDLTDLSTVLNNFGAATPAWTSGNFDNQPTIDLTDLSDVLNNFGASASSLQSPLLSTPAPEPASLLIAIPVLFLCRRTSSCPLRSR